MTAHAAMRRWAALLIVALNARGRIWEGGGGRLAVFCWRCGVKGREIGGNRGVGDTVGGESGLGFRERVARVRPREVQFVVWARF